MILLGYSMKNVVKTTDLINGWKKLGLDIGDKVIVHSSLSSLGIVDGGSETVIKSLQEAVGRSGILVMPAFTYGSCPFHSEKSPSVVGLISETFRQMNNVYSSWHPTHSFCIWGKSAKNWAVIHNDYHPFADNSPIGKLYKAGGKILLIGVDHRANTMIHLAEKFVAVPYISGTLLEYIDDGNIKKVTSPWRPGCSKGFNIVDNLVRRTPSWRSTVIGKAECQIMSAIDVVSCATSLLKKDKSALLCNEPLCEWCLNAREIVEKKRYE